MKDACPLAADLAARRLKAFYLEEIVTDQLLYSMHRLRRNTFIGPHLPDAPVRPSQPHVDDYVDPRRFAEDYQIASMLSKRTTLEGVDTELTARRKFFAAEAHNRLTNRRLIDDLDPPKWVEHVSRELLRILGPLTSEALNGMAEQGDFGPGACVGVASRELVPSKKYDSRPVMTEALKPLFSALAGTFVTSFWFDPEKLKVTRGNHHFTVPKNAETDRNAAKEPLWNSFLQKGIGKHVERRLKRFGVDIHDQTRNQFLASQAHVRGLATLDLSQASDMITHGCVWLLLTINNDPQGLRWWHLLNLARSKDVRIKDLSDKSMWHKLEMFCSMGNGFTFPLETAIFLAICRSVVPHGELDNMTVYGDDIIVPQHVATQLVDRLEHFGFQVNTSKSCLAGRFFESCGTDWLDGQNVRPFFLRWDPESPLPYEMQIANSLRVWLERIYGTCPSEFRPLWEVLRRATPKAFRCPVPVSLGDVGLVSSREEAKIQQSLKRPHGYKEDCLEGWAVKHAHVSTVDVSRRSFGVLARAVHAAGRSTITDETVLSGQGNEPWTQLATLGREALRNQFGSVRTKTTLIPRWDSVSDWV